MTFALTHQVHDGQAFLLAAFMRNVSYRIVHKFIILKNLALRFTFFVYPVQCLRVPRYGHGSKWLHPNGWLPCKRWALHGSHGWCPSGFLRWIFRFDTADFNGENLRCFTARGPATRAATATFQSHLWSCSAVDWLMVPNRWPLMVDTDDWLWLIMLIHWSINGRYQWLINGRYWYQWLMVDYAD